MYFCPIINKNMKTKIIIIIWMLFASLNSFAQKLDENKIDSFTKDTVKRTSWENLISKSFTSNKGNAYFRISKINQHYFFEFKYFDLSGSVFSISENDKLMLKLENDSIYTLKNLKYTITERGAGAIGLYGSAVIGINASYINLDDIGFKTLMGKKVIQIRFYTSLGYLEYDIQSKNAEKLINAVKLINQ